MHDPHPALKIGPHPKSVPQTGTVLMIGRSEHGAETHLREYHASVVACSAAALDSAILDRVLPDTVAFPLVAKKFDAAQIVGRLAQLGFTGHALIFAPRLPNREMILRELRTIAPGLSIQVIEHQSD